MAKVLDIERYLGHVRNRVNRVGVELEGLWTTPIKGVVIERDSSVKNFPTSLTNVAYGVGEIASPPIIPKRIEDWVSKHYPQYVNATCGLHLHMSFEKAIHYAQLMSQEYHDTMLDQLTKWAKAEGFPPDHCIFDRLSGNSVYCQLKFWPDKQVRQTKKIYDKDIDGHRYTAINYCHGLHNMQTLEVRVLPMMETPEQATRALLHIVRVTNACLVKLRAKEKPEVLEFKLDATGSPYIDRSNVAYR